MWALAKWSAPKAVLAPLAAAFLLGPAAAMGPVSIQSKSGKSEKPAKSNAPVLDPKEISLREKLRKQWDGLSQAGREEVIARVEGESQSMGLLAIALEKRAVETLAVDPSYLEAAGVQIQFYDPKLHAPGDPIPRRRLDVKDPAAAAEFERRTRADPPREDPRAWVYDWGKREVHRLPSAGTKEHLFEMFVRGLPARADLAEAAMLCALDQGAAQKELGAFAHAYTDRSGNVYPGLTLYDVWSSGSAMEMPDVDVLGIIHDVHGEWDRWRAPMPDTQHEAVYAVVAKDFARAKRYRALRQALAHVYLQGEPMLREGQGPARRRLHGLWVEFQNDAAALSGKLPGPEDLDEFSASWTETFEEDFKRLGEADKRIDALAASRKAIQGLLSAALSDQARIEAKAKAKVVR